MGVRLNLLGGSVEAFWGGCRFQGCRSRTSPSLSGPLNRLNAILSLLHPLNRKGTLSAMGSAIGSPYLALSRIHTQVAVFNRLVPNRLQEPRDSGAIVSKTTLKHSRNKNAIGRDSQPRPRPRLNSQLQGRQPADPVVGDPVRQDNDKI